MKFLYNEWNKQDTRILVAIGLVFIAVTSIVAISITLSYVYELPLDRGMSLLWEQLTIWHGSLFFPIVVSLFVAQSLSSEDERKGWQFMKANNMCVGQTLLAKLLSIFIVIAALQVVVCMVFVGAVLMIDGLSFAHISLLTFIHWFVLGTVGTVGLIGVQSYIYIRFRSLATAVGIATAGSFSGFALFFVGNLGEVIRLMYPYTQMTVGFRTRELTPMTPTELLVFIIANIIWFGLGVRLSIQRIKKEAI